jgi:NitT/TauT family transport system substrate-binding protein
MQRRDLLKLMAAVAASGVSSASRAKDADIINIQFTRFSAFYTPLIVVIAGGYLEQVGLKAHYSVAPVGKSAMLSLADGSAHVVQSAPSVAFAQLEKGIKPTTAHFAQINGKDGFFLVAKDADPEFSWSKLKGASLLISFDTQPMAMFRYACMKEGVDPGDINLIKGGSDNSMIDAYQAGKAHYIHLQGPGPQLLEKLDAGHIVATLGQVSGPCAFSSLAANRDWLTSDTAKRFTLAYRHACKWISDASASDVAGVSAHYFDQVDVETLTAAVAAYKTLGTWSEEIVISRSGYEVTLDVFMKNGLISKRYAYDDVVVAPPA